MKLLISVMSIILSGLIYYFTIVNLLYFKLKIIQKVLIYFMIVVGLAVTDIIGNHMIILTLGCVYLYINTIRNNKIPNAIVIIYGYVFDTVIDHLVTLGFSIVGIEVSDYMILYLLGINVLLFFLTYWLQKIVIRLLELPPQISVQIALFLLVCLSIFVFNIVAGEKMGYTDENVFFNSVLFVFYFCVFTILALTLIKKIEEYNDVLLKNESFKNLQVYTSKIEKAYNEVRSVRHDYMNIMLAMKDYIDERDIEGIKRYFYENVIDINEQILQSKSVLNCLINMKIIELKSIISSKVIYAMEIGIHVNLEVQDVINHVDMKILDLIRIMGIFIDNAIEAASISEERQLGIICIKNKNNIQFIILNTYNPQEIRYNNIKRKYLSTKGENRGIGLDNVNEILLDYNNILLNTSVNDYFKQELVIMNIGK